MLVLNNITNPSNTINKDELCKLLGLPTTYSELGDLRFRMDNSELILTLKLPTNLEYLRATIEQRARKEIFTVLSSGFCKEISDKDFYHGHVIMDEKNPTEIYILYHTYEFSKP